MATIPSEPTAAAPRLPLKLAGAPGKARKRRSRFMRWTLGLLLLGVIAGSVWAATGGIGGFMSHETVLHVPTQKVHRQDLLITVTEDGNVESAKNVDVRCQVAGGSSILWIIPDGSEVKQGDELVRLNSATIEDQVNQQKILYEKAQATRIDAEKMFSAAKLAVQEYIEGTYIKELQLIEATITISMENLRGVQNSLQHTERMARKGYVTPLQLDAQKFAVERAKLDLSAAETSKSVLEKFTKAKMLEDLESARDSAEARMRSEQAACELELTRLKRLMTQLEQCTITAPQNGMVVYANEYSSSSRSSSSSVKIEEGAMVRERQAIVRLPADLSQMQVKVIVHESKVDSIQPGMRAGITIQDREFHGEVISVANQPEPTSYFSSNVKEYATVVRIDGHTSGLKPGMTAEVEILVADLKNVLSVPVQAVKEIGNNTFFCWVKQGSAIERRQVKIGQSNNTVIEITQGLVGDEEVVLNPEAPTGREDTSSENHVDVATKFGRAKVKTAGRSQRKGSLQPGDGGPKQPGAPTPEAGKRVASAQPDFAQLDRDGDHKISIDEAPDRMREYFPLIDTNHDGGLDAAEMAAARARRGQNAAGPGAGTSSPGAGMGPGAGLGR